MLLEQLSIVGTEDLKRTITEKELDYLLFFDTTQLRNIDVMIPDPDERKNYLLQQLAADTATYHLQNDLERSGVLGNKDIGNRGVY